MLFLALATHAMANGSTGKRGDGYNRRSLHPSNFGPGKTAKHMRLIWATFCKAPEGQGLALDGLDQHEDDSAPHTRVLADGKWRNLYPELRKKNPLQAYCDRANESQVALRRARALARHIWFKGLEPEAERERLDKEAVPAFEAFLKSFETLDKELAELKELPAYEQGQVAFARRHFARARELFKTAEGVKQGVLQSEPILAMQQAQVAIEIGADALDAEPPPRVLSTPVYDKKTGLYILFGGDHFDYLTNDTWVFDPQKRQWFQKHPESAPDPRANHDIKATGNGAIQVSNGYMYKGGYVHVGPTVWTYDIAENTWTPKTKAQAYPPDTRQYWGGNLHPAYFLQGPKPNAAEHEKKLANLPANEWVPMNPPRRRAGSRHWGTKALATDYDLIVDWNGGHSSHCSTTAPHYHLGTNRWELPYPEELPLGMIGASGDSVTGLSFNGNRFIRNHSWSDYVYDRKLKKIVQVCSQRGSPNFISTYDPLLAEWRRYPSPLQGSMAAWMPDGTVAAPFTPKASYLRLDYENMRLKSVKTQGEFARKAAADWFGLVADPKRNRLLGMGRPGKGGCTGTEIRAIELDNNKVVTLRPENPRDIAPGCIYIREWRYIPDLDIFLICDGILEEAVVRGQKKMVPGNKMAAYDPNSNRWLVLNIKNQPIGHRKSSMYGWNFGARYDAKRKLLWGVDGNGYVCADRPRHRRAQSQTR